MTDNRLKISNTDWNSEQSKTLRKTDGEKCSKKKRSLTIDYEYSDSTSSTSEKHSKQKKFKRLKTENYLKESKHVKKSEKVNDSKNRMQPLTIKYEHTRDDSMKQSVKKFKKSDTEVDSDWHIASFEEAAIRKGRESDSEENEYLSTLDIESNLTKEKEDVNIKTETSKGEIIKSNGVEKIVDSSHKSSVKNSESSAYIPSWIKSDSDISDGEKSENQKVKISLPSSAKPIHRKKNKNIKVKEVSELPPCNIQDDIKTLLEMKQLEERIPRELWKHLRNIKITLRHTVPIQHTVESKAGTHALTPEQNKRFASIIPITKGSFTPAEDNIIITNWETFCKTHNWNPKHVQPFLYLKQYGKFCIPSVKERKKFVQFLADGLPSRTLYSVYHRFRNLHEAHKQSRYDSNEDAYILSLFVNNTTLNKTRKFADLGKILNRTRASVYRRYRILKRRQELENNLSIE